MQRVARHITSDDKSAAKHAETLGLAPALCVRVLVSRVSCTAGWQLVTRLLPCSLLQRARRPMAGVHVGYCCAVRVAMDYSCDPRTRPAERETSSRQSASPRIAACHEATRPASSMRMYTRICKPYGVLIDTVVQTWFMRHTRLRRRANCSRSGCADGRAASRTPPLVVSPS